VRPLVLAAAAAVLLLAGCSGDSSGPADPAPSAAASSARPSDAPTPPYGASLVAGDEDGTATLTNTGRKADRFVVVVAPSSLGAAAPAMIELKPGASAEVRYQLVGADGVGGSPVLQAHSTTTGEDTELPLD
jgi:hypothetical protein